MISLYRLIFIICLALLPFGSFAQDIKTIMEETSFKERLNEIPQEMYDQFAYNPFNLPTAENKWMIELFKDAFVIDTLMKDAQETFRRNFNSAYADSTIRWFNKKSIQNLLEAEKESYTLQGIRKRVVSKYELEQQPPTDTRKSLIQTLIKYLNTADTELEASSIIFRSFVSAYDELDEQQSFTEAQVDEIVNNFKAQVQSQLNQEIVQRMLVTYHELDDKTLQEYIRFHETDAGNWLSNIQSASFKSAYEAAADRFLNSVQAQ